MTPFLCAISVTSGLGGTIIPSPEDPPQYTNKTEENENTQMVMNGQPESSYWFPQQLLDWNPDEDPDFGLGGTIIPSPEDPPQYTNKSTYCK